MTVFQDSLATARCKDERAIVWDSALRGKDKKRGRLRTRHVEESGSMPLPPVVSRVVCSQAVSGVPTGGGRLTNYELRSPRRTVRSIRDILSRDLPEEPEECHEQSQ